MMRADWELMTPRLLELLDEGVVARLIADILNREFGCKLTKNAIIGRSNRLRHEADAGKSAPHPHYRAVSVLDAQPDQCRWIEGEPVGDCFCGMKVRFNTSWCEEHYARIYPKPVRRTPAQMEADEMRRRLALRERTMRITVR